MCVCVREVQNVIECDSLLSCDSVCVQGMSSEAPTQRCMIRIT